MRMRQCGRPARRRAARNLFACLLCILAVPAPGSGEDRGRSAALPARVAAADPEALPTGTSLSRLDAGLLAGGTVLTALGSCGLSPRKRDVPREGLDPDGISLALDRNAVRMRTHRPIDVGNGLFCGALAHPAVLGIASVRGGGRWSGGARALIVQAEALLLAGGTSYVLKRIVSRPRPYTYLPVYERSERGANWATSDQTFESFPSGHAATAWASSMVAVTSLAIRRADLSPATHLLNGLVAGGLATSTSLLRVEAGMHFPTDAAMGAVLGAAAGTIVPLAHHGFRTGPLQARALKWGWVGVGGGCLVALLLTPPTSPWVD